MAEITDSTIPQYTLNMLATEAWCKEMWIRKTYTNNELIAMTGTPQHVFHYWLYGRVSNGKRRKGWKHEKETKLAKAVRDEISKISDKLDATLNKMLNVLESSMTHLIDNNISLDISNINKLATSSERVFKMRQLVMGSPTEIYASKNMTFEDILKEIKAIEEQVYHDAIDITELSKQTDPIKDNG